MSIAPYWLRTVTVILNNSSTTSFGVPLRPPAKAMLTASFRSRSPNSPRQYRFPPESQQAFPGDHFEMAFLVPATNITTVDPYRQGAIRRWQLVPVPLATFDKRPLLFAHLVLQPLG